MKFLIAGLGSIGRRHMRNLEMLGEKDILLYRSYHGQVSDKELLGHWVETDLAAALARKPQAVVVSNPTSLHLEVAISAVLAGCHILLEKPVSHTLEHTDELINAVKKSGSHILVGYQFRFHPGLQRLRQLIKNDVIGTPYSVRCHWGEYLPGWHPGEDYRQGYSARSDLGGGVILTLSHPFDYLRWMFGEVEEVWAFTGRLGKLGLDVEDTAEIGMQFANGLLASLHLDYNQRPPAHTLEVIGTEGILRWDNADGKVALISAIGDRVQYFSVPIGFERNSMFLAEMYHFTQVVRGEAKPACSLDDGIKALELCLAALQSVQERRSVRVSEVRYEKQEKKDA